MSELGQPDGSAFRAPRAGETFGATHEQATAVYNEAARLTSEGDMSSGDGFAALTKYSKNVIAQQNGHEVASPAFVSTGQVVDRLNIAEARDNVAATPATATETPASVEVKDAPTIDSLIDYFADNKNQLDPNPDMIRGAGKAIADYFMGVAESGKADESFATNLFSTVSATAAILKRDERIHDYRQGTSPFVGAADRIHDTAWNIYQKAEHRTMTRTISGNEAVGKPDLLVNIARQLLEDATPDNNPNLAKRYAGLGAQTAELLTAAADAGALNDDLDLSGTNPDGTKVYHHVAYKNYIANHLTSTLMSIRATQAPVAA